MQVTSALWGKLFGSPHKTEYRFDINGVTYSGNDIKGAPVIVKPLMDTPAIGRVCTGSLKFTIYPKAEIPKAAAVNAYCRLISADGNSVSEWLSQGRYFITSRTGKETITLSCLDLMIKTGTTYRDKSKFTEWPMPMADVVNEICAIMGVPLDSRTSINTGDAFVVNYPNDDVLISEILGMIGVAHGGNWIITEQGKLRLVVFASPQSPVQDLGKTHKGFSTKGKKQTLSRVILTDSADNDFTAGDDTGFIINAKCDYATQEIANLLCAPGSSPVSNGEAFVLGAALKNGNLTVTDAKVKNGVLTLYSNSILYGASYEPYSVDCAYLNPAIELGDTISIKEKNGAIHSVVVWSVTMNCTVACTCSLIASVKDETEDEYPYISMQDLAISRTLKTNQSYFGNRITRSDGFVSELLVNDKATARLTANAALFSMQSTDEQGNWVDRIYFDTKTGKYVISADVTINGVITATDLSTSGKTIITGDNITTGVLKSKNGKVQLNLDDGTFTVSGTDVANALDVMENGVTLLASSQMFTKAGTATAYTPSEIVLTAQSSGTIVSFKWYKNGALISGENKKTLTVTPNSLSSGSSATYKVEAVDAAGNTFTDFLSIAKLSDGSPGSPGSPGKNGVDGYTVLLSDEYLEIPVDTARKPAASATKTCTVKVYKGVTPLTATLNATLADGQFSVSTTNTITGVTVTQTTAGTLSLAFSKETAIADSAILGLSIKVYGGFTLTANIVIKANMNAVTVKQQSSIEANEKGIALKVSKGEVISTINQSAEEITIDAARVNLSGYVTIKGLSEGTTTINGACITTGTIDASKVTVSNLSASNITSGTLSASRISGGTLDASQITVSNLSASSITSGTLSANRISGGTLDASKVTVSNLNASNITSGTLNASKVTVSNLNASNITSGTLDASKVTVSNLSASNITSGTLSANRISGGTLDASKVTVSNINASNITSGTLSADRISGGTIDASKITVKNLNASNITTGTLSADRIDVSTMKVQTIYTYSSSYYIALKTSGTTSLYLGGDGSWNMSYIYIYAKSSIYFRNYSWSYGIEIDLYSTSATLRPSYSLTADLGSSSYKFRNAYLDNIGSSSYPTSNMYVTNLYVKTGSVQLGSSTSSKVGFFGTSPTAKRTVSTSSATTVGGVNTALNNLINALKNYGLV